MRLFFYPLFFLIFLSSCRGPEKLLEVGKYDLIIKRSANVFKRRRSNPYKWVIAVEQAYAIANEKEWAFIRANEKEENIPALKEIYYTALKIERRQNKVAKLLPVVAENGYVAKFEFSDVRTIIEKTRTQIAVNYYALAKDRMQLAHSGSKRAALHAIQLIDSAMTWVPELDGIHQLRKEAVASAIVRVAIYVDDDRGNYSDTRDFEENLKDELDYFYRQYLQVKVNPSPEFKADYYLFLKPSVLYIGPDEEWSSTRHFSKEIVTGTRTEKEWNEADSVWVTKTIEIRETVCATVTTYWQSKDAEMTVDLTVEDPKYYQVYARTKLYASDDFSNKYSDISGDDRAIDCIIFTGSWSSYPSDQWVRMGLYRSIASKVAYYMKGYEWWPK